MGSNGYQVYSIYVYMYVYMYVCVYIYKCVIYIRREFVCCFRCVALAHNSAINARKKHNVMLVAASTLSCACLNENTEIRTELEAFRTLSCASLHENTETLTKLVVASTQQNVLGFHCREIVIWLEKLAGNCGLVETW